MTLDSGAEHLGSFPSYLVTVGLLSYFTSLYFSFIIRKNEDFYRHKCLLFFKYQKHLKFFHLFIFRQPKWALKAAQIN